MLPAQSQRRLAVDRALSDNQHLLDSPSPYVTHAGVVEGVPVWKPVKDSRKHVYGAEATRIASVVIFAPSCVVDRIWRLQHDQRRTWDVRTCEKCETLFGTVDDPKDTPVQWFVSKPKPLLTQRDFLYANERVEGEKGCVYFAGGSLLCEKGQLDMTRSQKGYVRAFLQGLARVRTRSDERSCEVTYLLRCAPCGRIPQLVIDAVGNELVFTLFDMKRAAEKISQSRL